MHNQAQVYSQSFCKEDRNMYRHMCNCLFTYQPFDVYITFRFKKANGHTLSVKFETSLSILQHKDF